MEQQDIMHISQPFTHPDRRPSLPSEIGGALLRRRTNMRKHGVTCFTHGPRLTLTTPSQQHVIGTQALELVDLEGGKVPHGPVRS